MADEWATGAANASLDLGQGARFAQGAADALRSVGIKPLEGAKIAQSIAGVANKPEFAGNDLLAGAAKNVADDIAKWTGSGGVIDAVALDAIRKNSVNAAIQQLRPGVDATTQRNLAAGVLSKVKPLIDDALEAAGGLLCLRLGARLCQGIFCFQQIAEAFLQIDIQFNSTLRQLFDSDRAAAQLGILLALVFLQMRNKSDLLSKRGIEDAELRPCTDAVHQRQQLCFTPARQPLAVQCCAILLIHFLLRTKTTTACNAVIGRAGRDVDKTGVLQRL